MLRVLFGFVLASALWAGGVGYLLGEGRLAWVSPEEAAPELEAEEASGAAEAPDKAKARRKQERRLRAARAQKPRSRELRTGDDIDWDGPRQIDMNAGEAQLSGTQIDAGFDSVMGRIRRCLILVPGDGEISGKLLFSMRVGGDGKPRAVQLSGPSVVVGGESGACLREAAQSIRFASFDGPDMLFKYPITLQ